MASAFGRMESGFSRAGRSFSTGRFQRGAGRLRFAGRATKSGWRNSRLVAGALLTIVAIVGLVFLFLQAALHPTPNNVAEAATAAATQDVPDPTAIIWEGVLAIALFVGGFLCWLAWKHRED